MEGAEGLESMLPHIDYAEFSETRNMVAIPPLEPIELADVFLSTVMRCQHGIFQKAPVGAWEADSLGEAGEAPSDPESCG